MAPDVALSVQRQAQHQIQQIVGTLVIDKEISHSRLTLGGYAYMKHTLCGNMHVQGGSETEIHLRIAQLMLESLN